MLRAAKHPVAHNGQHCSQILRCTQHDMAAADNLPNFVRKLHKKEPSCTPESLLAAASLPDVKGFLARIKKPPL
jgi:hypothetical protein